MLVTKIVTYDTDELEKGFKVVENTIKIFNAIADDPEELTVDLRALKALIKGIEVSPVFTGEVPTKKGKKKVSLKNTLETVTPSTPNAPIPHLIVGPEVLPEDVAIMTAPGYAPYPRIKGKVEEFNPFKK